MDQRLKPADPALVRRMIGERMLSSPMVSDRLGDVTLQPHQVDAATRLLDLLDAAGGALLADATGMGKTFVAIAIARAFAEIVIVAPAALRAMWHASLGRTGLAATVVSYEGLSRGDADVSVRPTLLVLDEAHHARNAASKRYARIADLAWGATVLLLTATPIHNRRRDLRALLALFLGSRADDLSEEEIARYIVRRTPEVVQSSRLPSISQPTWLEVPRSPEVLHALRELPPGVPAADGGSAHALMVLGLIRAWASSEGALRSTLKRRLRRIASFTAALESGRVPDRREVASWPVIDDAVQLGFPELFSGGAPRVDLVRIREALERHRDGIRVVIDLLDQSNGSVDRVRAKHLADIRARHGSCPVVAFSQFADTAGTMFRESVRVGGVALVTGSGARIASGRVPAEEIIAGFDGERMARASMPLELLIATDVLSEGLSLRRAGVIVHLDVPWTLARLEQRVGRLRRLGSPHLEVVVYAIGPPVESRELTPVLRALQRKARITAAVAGEEELRASMPLFGERLERATRRVIGRSAAAETESLRVALGHWAAGVHATDSESSPSGPIALALVRFGCRYRLLAIDSRGVFENPVEVCDAVTRLATDATCSCSVDCRLPVKVNAWLDQQRARDLVRQAVECPSPSHTAMLRALQSAIVHAPRADRMRVRDQVERCRYLVMQARGVGSELCLLRHLDDHVDLASLENALIDRVRPDCLPPQDAEIVAIIEGCDRGAHGAFLVSVSPQRRAQGSDD